jgi:hypothetical protein
VALFVALSALVFILVGTAVGLRIVLRARVDRSLPELAIGTALVAFSGVVHPSGIARAALQGHAGIPVQIGLQLLATGASCLTVLALYLFTWRVFRPEARWAVLLFAGGSALGLWAGAGTAALAFYGGDVSPELLGPWIALSALAYAICFGWAGVESLVFHARLRRRHRLGLADPLLVNRFLLWGTGCTIALIIDLALMGLAVSAVDFTRHPLPQLLVSASGLTNAVVWFLGFTPPAWYARWVRGDAAGAPAPA